MSAVQPELSYGSILKLSEGIYLTDELVLQILDFNCLDDNLVTRLRISDGMFSTRFAVMCGNMMDELKMVEHCVVQLLDYEIKEITKNNEKRHLVIIHNAKVLSHHKTPIGNPENLDVRLAEEAKTEVKTETKTEIKTEENVKVGTNTNAVTEKKVAPFPTASNFQPSQKVEVKPVPCSHVTVASLGSTVKDWKDWVIKVRVVHKLPILPIYGGQGKMRAWDLADNTATIRALAFDEQCDRLEPMQLNKGYWLRGAQIRTAKDPKLTGHHFELKLEHFTFVRECEDDSDLPAPKFNFTPLSELASIMRGKVIDIVAVCSRATEMMQKNKKCPRVRRVMLVSPDVGLINEIEMELKGQVAEQFDVRMNPVVVIKSCRYMYYEVKPMIFLNEHSFMLVDPPNIPEAVFLKSWYREKIKLGEVKPQTVMPPPEQNEVKELIETNSFAEARKKVLLSKVKTAYVKCMVTVIDTDSQFFVNMTCTSCQSQVYDMNLEKLVCPSCGYVEGGVIKNLLTKIRVGEGPSSEWAHMTDAQCRKVLGVTSNFLAGHDESLWHSLQGLVGKQFYAHLKFDKNKGCKMPCQVLDFDPIPESVYF